MDKRIKILTIGSAMYDIFLQYTSPDILTLHSMPQEQQFLLLETGKKCTLEDVSYYTGGGATNSAVSFARLGFEVSSFFKTGNDTAGKAIIDELSKHTIHTKYILKSNTENTGTSFVIPSPSGDRTTLMHRGANTTLTQAELPFDAIENHDCIYITSLSGKTAEFIVPITQYAKKHMKIVAVNPGTSQLKAGAKHLRNALPTIDILILNAYEASLLMYELNSDKVKTEKNKSQKTDMPNLLHMPLIDTSFDLRIFFKQIFASGVRIIVVTNGQEGVYVAYQNTIYFHPSLKTKVISTLGAGDAFSSCFVAQIALNKPIDYAIRSGIINASSVLEYIDTKTGLLTTKELEKRIHHINRDLLKTFKL
jgi:sugar/nucleoside kinase (ribokinase family)